MQADTAPRTPEKISPYQEAIDLVQSCLDRHEAFATAHPGEDSRLNGASYQRYDLPEDGNPETGDAGFEETLEVASGRVGYLKITHRQRWDNELRVPRFVDSYTTVADYGDTARAGMVISDGRLLSADYRDYAQTANSVQNNPEGGFDMALFVINTTQEELLANPARPPQ